jgi:hypothetical protein
MQGAGQALQRGFGRIAATVLDAADIGLRYARQVRKLPLGPAAGNVRVVELEPEPDVFPEDRVVVA